MSQSRLERLAAWRVEGIAVDDPLDWDDNTATASEALSELQRRISHEHGRRQTEARKSLERITTHTTARP